VKIPTQSKPITTKVNKGPNKFQKSQPKLSSSTSTKPIVPENVKQVCFSQSNFIFFECQLLINIPCKENGNQQGFETLEGDDYEEEEVEEEIEDEDHEEPLENSKSVASTYKSKQTLSMKSNDSSNKFQTSQPMLSSSTSTKPIVPESVKQVCFSQSHFIFNRLSKLLINIS